LPPHLPPRPRSRRQRKHRRQSQHLPKPLPHLSRPRLGAYLEAASPRVVPSHRLSPQWLSPQQLRPHHHRPSRRHRRPVRPSNGCLGTVDRLNRSNRLRNKTRKKPPPRWSG
jgi:hypothetical protein